MKPVLLPETRVTRPSSPRPVATPATIGQAASRQPKKVASPPPRDDTSPAASEDIPEAILRLAAELHRFFQSPQPSANESSPPPQEQSAPLLRCRGLSGRELEIARLVALGHPNKFIADVLQISVWTVGTHMRRIFAKLGVNSRAAMVSRIHQLGSEPLTGMGKAR